MEYSHERKEKPVYKGPPAVMPDEAWGYWPRVSGYLADRGLSLEVARANGWYPTAWDVPRLVIPCSNTGGSVYFQARRMDYSGDFRYRSPKSEALDSVVICWPYEFVVKHPHAVIVEGPMDALAAACLGYVGVGLMGNKPPPERLEFIVATLGKSHAPFIIVPDLDDQAFGASLVTSFAMLGVTSAIAMPVGGKDLCEMSEAGRCNLLTSAMKGLTDGKRSSVGRPRSKVSKAKVVQITRVPRRRHSRSQ